MDILDDGEERLEEEFYFGTPKIVSGKNHFTPLAEMVDMYFFRFDTQSWTEKQSLGLRRALLDFGRELTRNAELAFTRGAERGISQTANLLIDPEYYASTKKRREQARKVRIEKSRAEREEQIRKSVSPATPQEVANKRRNLIQMRDYYQIRADEYAADLAEFEKNPHGSLDLSKVAVGTVAQ